MKRITLLAITALLGTFSYGQIQVDYQTAEEAVSQLLGPGVSATNIQFTGAAVQLGLMYGAEGLVFEPDSGVVLSCADVNNIVLPGGAEDVPFGEGVSGDPDLLDIANSVPPLIGQNFSVSAVNDLAILEFDFVPSGDSLSFNYSFGSDEYLTWVNSSFNDIFAFFLSGPGLVGPYAAPAEFPDGAVNIASVPESDPLLPITISSVNNVLNQEYYIDNPTNQEIAINGYTVQFTASAQVQCGETYHIKLAIADGSDTALESIVVIEAGSFQSPSTISASVPNAPPTLPELTMLEGCVDGVFTVFRPNTEAADMYVYIIAEIKSVLIGRVSRILKQSSVDCILNHGQTNFTEEKFNKEVNIKLANGTSIPYKIGDKPYSSVCDYMESCSYNCEPNKQIDKINLYSYDETFILLNNEKIIQKVKDLFKERYVFKKEQLIVNINVIRTYPLCKYIQH